MHECRTTAHGAENEYSRPQPVTGFAVNGRSMFYLSGWALVAGFHKASVHLTAVESQRRRAILTVRRPS